MRDVLALVGAASLILGVALIYWKAAPILFGLMTLFVAVRIPEGTADHVKGERSRTFTQPTDTNRN